MKWRGTYAAAAKGELAKYEQVSPGIDKETVPDPIRILQKPRRARWNSSPGLLAAPKNPCAQEAGYELRSLKVEPPRGR